MNQNIEVQERLQTQSLNNLPESLQRFLITARGKYMWLEPHCKHCNSPNVVHNGYYICESFIIKALNLDIKHGHYLCKDCNLTFSTPFPELQSFLQDLQTFLAETCFHLFTNGMTFDGIAQYITEQYKIALSDETARRYYKDCAQSYREEKSLVSSGYFSVDCQHLKVNGNHAVRLSVIDIVNKILAHTESPGYITHCEKQAKVKEYERQIDQMVYKLYGLTPEEVNIIEGWNHGK